MTSKAVLDLSIEKLIEKYSFAEQYLNDNKINLSNRELSLNEYLENLTALELEEWAIDIELIKEGLIEYIEQISEFLGIKEDNNVREITIIAGLNKMGEKENFESFTIKQSEIVSIVGPTGSGKSRLLADIEWTANEDTPTNRTILINGELPDKKWRFSSGNKLVAQLSQNMNFVMDLTVREFVELHARSRMVENEEYIIQKIIQSANELAGEKFELETPVTALSGGQSRALMIADTAILSKSPIVLIDEIENAGIDRKKALKLLVNEEKIVLMATHDPILALMADKRIVINNGGIIDIIKTTEFEKKKLTELEKIDAEMQELRTILRYGQSIEK